jgi:autotransporter translocation and assembly factor TamB
LKAACRALLVLPLLLLAVLSYLVFAERGARVLLNVLQSATPLEIQYSGGSLAGTLKIERLSLQTDELGLAMDNLALKLNPNEAR